MAVLDDEGRLFGVVNVVDVLVVCIAAGIVVGGAAVTFDTTDDETITKYATLTYTVPLDSEPAQLQSGETLRLVDGRTTFTAIEVYRSFESNATAFVAVRVEYTESGSEDENTVYGGNEYQVTVNSYRVPAFVTAVDEEHGQFRTGEVPVVLATKSKTAAQTLDSGDEARIGDDVVATVESVTVPSDSDRARVGLMLSVREAARLLMYGSTPVRVGERITVLTDEVSLSGRIVAVNTADATNATAG